MELVLPTRVDLHTLRNLLLRTTFIPPAGTQRVLVRFHPQKCYLHPMALSLLAAWAEHVGELGLPFEATGAGSQDLNYARRMGLFDFLPDPGHVAIKQHDDTGRFVPLMRIQTQSQLNNFVREVLPLLHNPALLKPMRYCLHELVRNVLEHAGHVPAFVCAQYYPQSGKTAIGIADCGLGLRDTLSRAYHVVSDADAARSALKPGVTCATPAPYSSPDNAGAGLFYVRSLARASGAYFAIVSGTAALRIRRNQEKGSAPPADPCADLHDLWDDLPGWPGTAVGLELTSSVTNSFDDVLQSISEVFSQGHRSYRNSIRFT